MINEVEYQKIKKIGTNIGDILNLYFDDMEDIHEIHERVVNISKDYIVKKDISALKQSIHNIIPDLYIQEQLCSLMQEVSIFNRNNNSSVNCYC